MGSYRADETRLHSGGPGEPVDPADRGGSGDIGLTVNGAARRAPAGLSVAALLVECGLAGRPCAVEVNRALVPKSRHGATALRDGDVVELVTLVGGG